jgi:uncharacterized membrane protein
VNLLKETLADQKETDEKLTVIAEELNLLAEQEVELGGSRTASQAKTLGAPRRRMVGMNRKVTHTRKHPIARLGRLGAPELASIVEHNIAAIEQHKREAENARSFQERVADVITRVSGSLAFVCLHVVWFGLWVLANVGLLGIEPFDPFPFGLLTTIVSLEAIFLSTFVLVSQNRQSAIADRRAQLDLQINLLAEYEVTRLLKLQDAIAKRLNVNECNAKELKELERDIEPEAVLEKLEAEENNANKGNQHVATKKNGKPKNEDSPHGQEKEIGKTRAHHSQRG